MHCTNTRLPSKLFDSVISLNFITNSDFIEFHVSIWTRAVCPKTISPENGWLNIEVENINNQHIVNGLRCNTKNLFAYFKQNYLTCLVHGNLNCFLDHKKYIIKKHFHLLICLLSLHVSWINFPMVFFRYKADSLLLFSWTWPLYIIHTMNM